ncbi:hypothetical protein Q4Q35_08655, partial [Flavivirga aquimarina]|nr:hypothetical protein [Flavivirga aquimarina]
EVLEEEIVQTLLDIKEGKYSNILEDIDIEKEWKFLEEKKQRSGRSSIYLSSKREFWTYGVAASIILLISITFVFNQTNQNPGFEAPIIVNNNIESGSDKVILTLEDGSKVVLEKGTTYRINHVTSNGEEIIYLPAGQLGLATNNQITYNTLTIPRRSILYLII